MTIQKDILKCKRKCAEVKKEKLEEFIKNMPPSQREAIKTCFSAASLKSVNGRRYSLAWIYECLLLKIRSRGTYEHLRRSNMLPLPSVQTLNRYIRRISGSYGFQNSVFQLLKKKASLMLPEDRRGKYCFLLQSSSITANKEQK